MEKKLEKNWITISMSNESASAKTNKMLTIFQQRCFWFALAKFQQEYKYTKKIKTKIEIPVAEFFKFFKIDSTNTYRGIKQNAESMSSVQLKLIDDVNEKFEFFTIFPYFKYEQGMVTITINDQLKKHFFNLKERFIRANLKKLMTFKNKYMWVLYSLLKAKVFEKSEGYYKTSVGELKKRLFVDKNKGYKQYGSFKKKILQKTVSQLNEKTNLDITFKEFKRGRKVDSIVFAVRNNGLKKQNNTNFAEMFLN